MIIADAAYIFRDLARHRISTAAILISLSLGLGLNTAVFSFIETVVLSPFPYAEPDRLVVVWGTESFSVRRGMNGKDLDDWVRGSGTVEGLAAFQLTPFRFSLGTTSETMQAAAVGARLFSVLNVRPQLGRAFTDADSRSGGRCAVLSYDLWDSWLGRDPDIIGRALAINGEVHEVIGVMPRGFFFPDVQIRLWTLLAENSAEYRQVQAIARMRPNVSVVQVRAELNAVLQDRLPLDPRTGARIRAGVFPLRRLLIAEHEQASWLLYGAVSLLLLGACANVSSLLLTRALERSRELAVRVALGASPWGLVRIVLGEAVILSGIAGALAILVAYWTLAALRQIELVDIPRVQGIGLNAKVFLYAFAVSLLTGLLSGLIPSSVVARNNAARALRNADSGTSTRRVGRLRELLLAVEVCATVILLIGGGLLIRSFVRLSSVNWGFKPDNVVVAEVTLPASLVRDSASHVEFTESVLAKVGAAPAVETAAMAYGVPIRWDWWQQSRIAADGTVFDVGIWTVSHDYFRTLQIPVRRGREFHLSDRPSDRIAVVNERFGRLIWPESDPTGRHFTILKPTDALLERARRDRSVLRDRALARDPRSWEADGPPWVIIGEVADVRMLGLQDSAGPAIYLEYRSPKNVAIPRQSFIVRASVEGGNAGTLLRTLILASNPEARVDSVFNLNDVVTRSMGGHGSRGLLMLVSVLLAGLALSLAAVGVYSVASLAIARRLKEIAVRRALGARASHIVSAVWLPQMRVIGLATVAGLTGGYVLTRSLRGFLFAIQPTDPLTYATAGVLILLIALLASVRPLRQAMRMSPADVFRAE